MPTTVESLRTLYGNVPVYEVTREFTGGTLVGLTHTGLTTVCHTVGRLVARPCGGGSPYRVTACERVA